MRKLLITSIVLSIVAMTALAAAEKKDTNSLVGKPAPQFSLPLVTGKTMKLSEEHGNVVLMDMWATWCPPCRASLPHLQSIADDKELADKGLKVYAVNQGENKPDVQSFMKQNNLSFPCVLDKQTAVGNKYLVTGIPTTVIISRDGKVRNVWIGYGDGMEDQVRKQLDAALKEPKPAAKGPSTRPAN